MMRVDCDDLVSHGPARALAATIAAAEDSATCADPALRSRRKPATSPRAARRRRRSSTATSPPGYHPERPERLVAARAAVTKAAANGRAHRDAAATRRAARPRACSALRRGARALRGKKGNLDPDTYVRERSIDVATRAPAALQRLSTWSTLVTRRRARASRCCARPGTTRARRRRWASACSTTSPSRRRMRVRSGSRALRSSISTCTTETGRRRCSIAIRTCSTSRRTSFRSIPAPARSTRSERARAAASRSTFR